MHVQSFCVNPFQTNAFVCHDGNEAVLIDPGCAAAPERDSVMQYIRGEGVVLREILLTHAHIDHVLDLAYFVEELGIPYAMHRDDLPLIEAVETQAAVFGLTVRKPPPPHRTLEEGYLVQVGEGRWEVVHVPGHSPGSVAFIDRENRFVIAGDVLFQGSVGRTDLWRGSMSVLIDSINQKLLVLEDDFTVYAGHGPATTIGHERTTNPYLR